MTTVVTIGSVLILRLHGSLDEYLKKRNIKHNFIYPRCPRINHLLKEQTEPCKRSSQISILISQQKTLTEFNRRLMNYLLWYNTERHHKSLNKLTSIKLFAKILFIVSYLCNLYKALEKNKKIVTIIIRMQEYVKEQRSFYNRLKRVQITEY